MAGTQMWAAVVAAVTLSLFVSISAADCGLPAVSAATNSFGECVGSAGYWFTDGRRVGVVAFGADKVEMRRNEAFAQPKMDTEPRMSIEGGPGEIWCDVSAIQKHATVKFTGPLGDRKVVVGCLSNRISMHALGVFVGSITRTLTLAHTVEGGTTEYTVEPVTAFIPKGTDTFRDDLDTSTADDITAKGATAGAIVRAQRGDAFLCDIVGGKCYQLTSGGSRVRQVPDLPGGGSIWIAGFDVASGAIFASRKPGLLPSRADAGGPTLWVLNNDAWIPADPSENLNSDDNAWRRIYDRTSWGTTYLKSETASTPFDQSPALTLDANGVNWSFTARGFATRTGSDPFALRGLLTCQCK
eukprot:Opistho-2@31780